MKDILFETYIITLPFLLTYIIWVLKNQKKERSSNSRGLMLLLRVELMEMYNTYVVKGNGFITLYIYKSFLEIWTVYTDLGGNMLSDKWLDDWKELEIINE